MNPRPELIKAAYAKGENGPVLDHLTVQLQGRTYEGSRDAAKASRSAAHARWVPWTFVDEEHRSILRFMAGHQDTPEMVADRLMETLRMG